MIYYEWLPPLMKDFTSMEFLTSSVCPVTMKMTRMMLVEVVGSCLNFDAHMSGTM